MTAVALASLAGSLAVHGLPQLPGCAWIVPAVLLALVSLATPWRLPIAAALLSALWTVLAAQAGLEVRLPLDQSGRDVKVEGWIDGFPKAGLGQVSFSFRIERVGSAATQLPSRVRLTWYRPSAEIRAGDAWSLVVRLRPPRTSINPGGFDFEAWALSEGIGATGYVRSGERIPGQLSIARRWLQLRAELLDRMDRPGTSDSARGVLAALVLGDRSGFSDEDWQHLSRTGTSHLFSISGLHVGLVAGLFFMASRAVALRLPSPWALRDLGLASVLGLLAGTVYSALAGFTLPTIRSLIMLCCGFVLWCQRRPRALVDALALATIVILLVDPFAPLRASFWLSYGAVAVIGLAVAPRPPMGIARPRARAVRLFVAVQLALNLALLPATALFFNQISLVSPFVNLLAVPFFSIVLVPLALVYVALAALDWHGPFDLLTHFIAWLAEFAWRNLSVVAEMESAALTLAAPAAWVIAIASFGALHWLPGSAPWPGRGLAALLLGGLLYGYQSRPPQQGFDAHVLDVGHGLAVLVRTQRHALLYDAGPVYPSGFDGGRRIVVPALTALGIRRLDRVIISHGDADHAGGANSVLTAYPSTDLLVGAGVDLPRSRPCARGEHWQWDGVVFAVLHPELGVTARSDNDGSCVLHVSGPGGSLLLTGDIEAKAEEALVAAGRLTATDVVVMAHHGSATSSSHAFIAGVAPDWAIASAALGGRWDFPRPDVRARWERSGARVLTTGESGAITVSMRAGQPPTVDGARHRRRRYWYSDR